MPTELQDQTPNTDSQTDFDTTSAIAEISADLFGQGGESGDGVESGSDAGAKETPGSEKPVENPSSQPPAEDKTGQHDSTAIPSDTEAGQSPQNSQEVQDLGAPKSWSKEALAEWATLPPRAQQEILKREEDFLRGISMYKESAEIGQKYSKVVEPYAPILAAENVDPVQLFQAFAANHYLLSRGTEAQKLELAANMIQGYGIDFAKLVSFVGDRIIEPVDPRVQALEQQIAELKSSVTSRQQQEEAAVKQQLEKEIEAFAADPAYPFFQELVDDIAKLFETGQASNLKEAYDKAVYLNPVTRQKELDRLTAAKAQELTAAERQRQEKIAKSSAADLSLDPRSQNGTVPVGTIDETLAATMARIAGRS